MSERADYYAPDWRGHRRCRPGNTVMPNVCDYHLKHYWCTTCEGYYGVPHDFIHEGPDAHPVWPYSECACRPCQENQNATAGDTP
jgi:hypothetical protein